tara:strand:- start:476 stop:814 length:339 start_codon:yes stop_codon:yes gene_type:complete
MKMDKISKKKRIEAYLVMPPKIIILSLNHHCESLDSFDEYQKFDFECLIAALKTSNIDCSDIFDKEGDSLQSYGPFRLDNHPDHGFGIYISWELKQTISEFRNGYHWRIIGD